MAVSDAYLYWIRAGDSDLFRKKLDGTGGTETVRSGEAASARADRGALAVGGGRVAWSGPAQVHAVAIEIAGDPEGLAAAGDHIVYVSVTKRALRVIPEDQQCTLTQQAGTILRIIAATSAVDVIADGQPNPRDVAVTSAAVYWLNDAPKTAGGGIMKRPR